jgi:O-antigen/teichoic acid export membrane protein
MNFKKTAISSVKWSSVDKFGKAAFQLIQIAILTRFLPKEAFGLVAIALVVIEFTNIFVDMGISAAILYKQDSNQKEYSSLYWLNIFISVCIYGVILLLTPLVANFYQQPELIDIIPLLGLNVVFLALGKQHHAILQKQFRFRPIALIGLCSYSIGLVVAIVLVYNNFGVYSLVYSTIVSVAISNLLFLITNFTENPILLHFNFNETKPYLRVGGYQTGGKILDYISKEADIFIIGKVLGTETLGLYTLTKQIVLKVYSIISPITYNVLSPLLSSIQNEKEKLKKYYLQTINLLTFVNVPAYLMIIAGSREILYLLYGSDYVEGYIVLSALSAFFFISSISNPVGSLQIATGRTDLGFYWTIIRVIISPLFIFIGALYSLEGVAVAILFLGILLVIPLWYVQIRPMSDISLTEYLQKFYRPFLTFFLIGLGMVFTQNFLLTEFPLFNLILKLVLSTLVLVIILLIVDNSSIKKNYSLLVSLLKNK